MALIVVCLGQLMMVVDMTIVNVALPVIQRDLHFSQANLTWVVGAYLISYGSFLLMAGRFGDLLGRKRVFLAGVLLFTIASALCGLANDQLVLIAARFLQGLGGAISTSVIIALIVTDFPRPAERVRAMGAYMFVVTSGGSLGLLLGGALVQSVDWHWIFYVNLPIGIAVLALGARLIENRPGTGVRGGVDVAGSVLVDERDDDRRLRDRDRGRARLGLRAHARLPAARRRSCSAPSSGSSRGSRTRSCRCACCKVRTLIGASAVRGFLVTGMFGTWVLGTLFVEHVLGYGAWDTGLAFLPMTLTVGALSLGTTARVMARLGPERTVVLGMCVRRRRAAAADRRGSGRELLPVAVLPVRADGARHGHGDAAAADDRDERRAGARRRPRVGHPQRLDAALGRARDRDPRHAGRLAYAVAHRGRHLRRQRAHERLPPRVRDRRRRCSRSASWSR